MIVTLALYKKNFYKKLRTMSETEEDAACGWRRDCLAIDTRSFLLDQ